MRAAASLFRRLSPCLVVSTFFLAIAATPVSPMALGRSSSQETLGGWSSELVPHDSLPLERWTCLAIDSSNHPHIAMHGHDSRYSNGTVQYVTKNETGWQSTKWSEAFVEGVTDILLKSSEQPLIRCGYHQDNWLYSLTGSTWSRVTLPSSYNGVTIATDRTGGIHFTTVSSGTIYYHTLTGTTWDSEPVAAGFVPVIDIDASGVPHIAFTTGDGGALYYTKRTGGAWQTPTLVHSGPVYWHSLSFRLAVSDAGTPQIAFRNASVHYLWLSPSGWTDSVLSSAGSQPLNFARDRNGTPCLIFTRLPQNTLHLAWVVSGQVQMEDTGIPATSQYALAFDTLDLPQIVTTSGSAVTRYWQSPEPHTVHVQGTIDPSDPPVDLEGVTVYLLRRGIEVDSQVTDALGLVSFPAVCVGDYLKATLDGPLFRVFDAPLNSGPGLATLATVPIVSSGQTTLVWPQSAALLVAYYATQYRNSFLRDQLGHTWEFPASSSLCTQSSLYSPVLAGAYEGDPYRGFDFSLASNLSTWYPNHPRQLECLYPACFFADVVYHEMGHALVSQRLWTFRGSCSRILLKGDGTKFTEGAALDEAIADYFAASFTRDAVMDKPGGASRSLLICLPYPTDGPYHYEAHVGSAIVSSALWQLRTLIDGPDGFAIPLTTDSLVFATVDTLIGRVGDGVYTMAGFFDALVAADVDQMYTYEINTAFASSNLGPGRGSSAPVRFGTGQGICAVDASLPGQIQMSWNQVPGAISYNIVSLAVDQSGAGMIGFERVAVGVVDTMHVFDREPDVEYWLTVEPVDSLGIVGYFADAVWVPGDAATGIAGEMPIAEGARMLFSAPNPTGGSTRIVFELTRAQAIETRVYDVSGRQVGFYSDQAILPSGRNEIVWNGQDERGQRLPQGVYFIQVRGEGWAETAKVILVR